MRIPLLALSLCLPFSALADKNAPITNPDVLRIARGVWTEPGDVPRLEVKGDEKLQLPLKHTHVHMEVAGPVARVEVLQTYENPSDAPIEAVYVFPLPEDSAVDDMHMRIGERIIRAEIKRRAEARKTYEDAKKKGHTAALLEQERPNVFTQSVANIAPGEAIEVQVRYVQRLAYDAGEYELVFPMVVGPRFIPGNATGKQGPGWSPDTDEVPDASRIIPPILGAGMRSGHDISLEVVIDAGLPIVDFSAPTHEVTAVEEDDGVLRVALADHDSIPNRDFVVRYRVDGDAPQAALLAHKDERGGFFSFVVQPPRLDVEKLVGKRELVFVVDVSGSMYGAPLALAKDAMREALAKTRPVDTFNIYTFAGSTQQLFGEPRPANDANLRRAFEFLDGVQAGGGTYMANAVEKALGPNVAPGRHRYVFFMTDGYVGNERAIFAGAEGLVRELKRKGQRAKVFSLGTGSSVNRHLLDGLAKAGKGAARYVTLREEPARAVNRFYRAIDHAVLSDIRIDWGELDVKDTWPKGLPDLFATRPLVVRGRYDRPGRGTVTLSAKVNGRSVELPFEVELPASTEGHDALATLWARAQVADLETRLWSGDAAPEVVEQITQTGLEFRMVTPYTSFVAVDRSRVVGDGDPKTIVQPVEAPEGVNPAMAAPPMAMKMVGTASGGAMGKGGLGLRGVGRGGGGMGYGTGPTMQLGASVAEGDALVADAFDGTAGLGVGFGRVDTGGGLKGKKQVVPRVRAAHPKVTGALDVNVVRRVIRRHHNEIRYLYEKQLKSNPNLKGRLVLELVIEEGKVVAAKVVESTLKSAAIEEGIVKVAKRWRFPKVKGGGKVVVRYPFVFSR